MTKTPIRGRLYYFEFACPTPGPEVERGDVIGRWTGEIDTWGKYTIQPANRALEPVYLFLHEVVRMRRVNEKTVLTAIVMKECTRSCHGLREIRSRLLNVKMGVPITNPLNDALADVANAISEALITLQAVR